MVANLHGREGSLRTALIRYDGSLRVLDRSVEGALDADDERVLIADPVCSRDHRYVIGLDASPAADAPGPLGCPFSAHVAGRQRGTGGKVAAKEAASATVSQPTRAGPRSRPTSCPFGSVTYTP